MANEFIVRKGLKAEGSVTFPYAAKTHNCEVTDKDYVIDCLGGSFTVTLPSPVGMPGKSYVIKNSGEGIIDVVTKGHEGADDEFNFELKRNDSLIVHSTGSSWATTASTGDINNPSQTRLLTSDGSKTGSHAESNLTFDGEILGIEGSILPSSDSQHTLGSAERRWAHVYTGDLHLRNERGDWTIVEEEDYLTVVNNKTGKRYKMALIPLD
jgi:hypothetical protein